MADSTIGRLTFREASDELRGIVASLEDGDLELEEALSSYTRGVELLTSLRARLDDADRQVSELLAKTGATNEQGGAA